MKVREFDNGPGDLGSIPSRFIPKTQKLYLMPHCLTLSIIRYGSRVKWSNPGKGIVPSPTPLGHHRLRSPTLKFKVVLYSFFLFPKIKNYG